MHHDDAEFRRVLEDIKLRTPIEEIVGERVHLVRKGRLLEACCPLHDEKTPSFKVFPEEGRWYCFGACHKGGDVITFLQEADGLTFMDAAELLARRAGVELPKRKRERNPAADRGLAALTFTDRWFRRQLEGPAGRAAREYLEKRGISRAASDAFGLGYAPPGRALVDAAAKEGVRFEDLERAGLARRGEDGGPYSFFRNRLTIPIRDLEGQTIAFGARRLEDAGADGRSAGPKYINSSETEFFHKGRVVYGLDRAIDAVRRAGHIVLVEGYTDVIAAHQAGVTIAAAVLGTATTTHLPALFRRAGARRISLVFDGDDAGRRAAYGALESLLGLDAELEVVVLPAGQDPADVLSGPSGGDAFRAHLAAGLPWLEFVARGIEALSGREWSRAVDRALDLVGHLKRPVDREAGLRDLAARIGIPLPVLREQLASRPPAPEAKRRAAAASEAPRDPEEAPSAGPAPPPDDEIRPVRPLDPRLVRAYEGLVGAALLDPSLCPRVRGWTSRIRVPELSRILDALLALWYDDSADAGVEVHAGQVMSRLASDPARVHVSRLVEHARTADDPVRLLEGELEFLQRFERDTERQELQRRLRPLELQAAAGDSAARTELDQVVARLFTLSRN